MMWAVIDFEGDAGLTVYLEKTKKAAQELAAKVVLDHFDNEDLAEDEELTEKNFLSEIQKDNLYFGPGGDWTVYVEAVSKKFKPKFTQKR